MKHKIIIEVDDNQDWAKVVRQVADELEIGIDSGGTVGTPSDNWSITDC